ncbi:MAG: hypothetical protein ABFE07_17515 [Armatimonadia bacterium]
MHEAKGFVKVGLALVLLSVLTHASAATVGVSLLPGSGTDKYVIRLNGEGFAPNSALVVRCSGERAAEGQATRPFSQEVVLQGARTDGEGKMAASYGQCEWGAFSYVVRDQKGNEAAAKLCYDLAGKVAAEGEWVYLKELYPNFETSGTWFGPKVNFEGQAYAYSYCSKTTQLPGGAFSLANLRHPGKPKLLEVTVGVRDETTPQGRWIFNIILDDQPPIYQLVRLGLSRRMTLNVSGVGRVEFTAKRVRGPRSDSGGPALIEPRLLY